MLICNAHQKIPGFLYMVSDQAVHHAGCNQQRDRPADKVTDVLKHLRPKQSCRMLAAGKLACATAMQQPKLWTMVICDLKLEMPNHSDLLSRKFPLRFILMPEEDQPIN